jgi:hypothetical protein
MAIDCRTIYADMRHPINGEALSIRKKQPDLMERDKVSRCAGKEGFLIVLSG